MSELSVILAAECVGMTDEEALSYLQAKTNVTDGELKSGEALAYIAGVGKLTLIETISKTEGHALRDGATAAMITVGNGTAFHFGIPAVLAMFNAFVVGGVLTQADVDTMRAMGQTTTKTFPRVAMGAIVRGRA